MFFKYSKYAIYWAGVIMFLSLTPRIGAAENYGAYFDKIVHTFLYAIFSCLLIVSFKKQGSYFFLKANSIIGAITVSSVFGVIMEVVQLAIPGRSLDIADMIGNSIGALVGVGLFYLIYKI
ncbi:MAG: VanZ family protein [Cyclobacteriaceae bacterium]